MTKPRFEEILPFVKNVSGGIGPGPNNGSGQALIVSATSGNHSLIPDPTVSYLNLDFTLLPNATGTSMITVSVRDNGGMENGGQDTHKESSGCVVAVTKDRKPVARVPLGSHHPRLVSHDLRRGWPYRIIEKLRDRKAG